MGKCEFCGKEVVLPYHCAYCAKYFCKEHRLPETHECFGISVYPKWQTRYYLSETEKKTKERKEEGTHPSQISAHAKEKRKPKKPVKKIVALLSVIIISVVIVWYAPTIISYFQL